MTQDWSESNKMKINESKTKELFISMKRPPATHPSLTINGKSIERVSNFKLLGIWMSDDLTWNEHVTHMLSRAAPKLYYLKQLKRAGLSVDDLIVYYRSVIRSSLEYASPVWNAGLTKKHSEDIERIQKRALKTIFPDSDYELALQISGLDQLCDRREKLDRAKFDQIKTPNHRLNYILPEKSQNLNSTRREALEYPKPKFHNKRFKKNFIVNRLYKQQ